MNGIEVKIHRNIDEINKDDWDRIAKNSSPFYNYGWFKTFHHTLGEPIYFAAYLGRRLVGILPGSIVRDPNTYVFHNVRDAIFARNDEDLLNFPITLDKRKQNLFSKLVKFYKLFDTLTNKVLFPNLTFVSPKGFVSDLIVDCNSSEQSGVIDAILDYVNDYCYIEKISTRAFLWLRSNSSYLKKTLLKRGYIVSFGEVDFDLNIKWPSIDGYCADLVTKRRNRVKKDMAGMHEEGIAIRLCQDEKEIEQVLKQMSVMHYNHISKHYERISVEEVHALLSSLHANMKDSIYTILAKKDNNIVGFFMGFKKGDTLYPKYFGYDKEYENSKYIYFNLCYYAHFSYAMNYNIKNIYYGFGTPLCKLKRGCKPNDVMSYFFFGNKIKRVLFNNHLSYMSAIKKSLYDRMGKTIKVWKCNC